MDMQRTTDMLIREEGCVLHAYQDHLGYWTIGVGRLIDERRGGGITRGEAEILLQHDIRRCERWASNYPWYAGLNDARKAVVIGMIFQLGTGGFHGFSATRAAIEAGDYVQASQRMLASKWADQTPARARRMAAQMRTGEWQ